MNEAKSANHQKSRMGGLFTILGILLAIIGLAYGAYKLNSFETQLKDIDQKLDNLNSAPIENLIELDAFAVPINDTTYDFTVRTAVPRQRKNEIKEVKYKFKRLQCYSERPNTTCVSNDPASDFAISCKGAKCESDAELELVLAGGKVIALPLNLCEALGE